MSRIAKQQCRTTALAPASPQLLALDDATQPSSPRAWAQERKSVAAAVRVSLRLGRARGPLLRPGEGAGRGAARGVGPGTDALSCAWAAGASDVTPNARTNNT